MKGRFELVSRVVIYAALASLACVAYVTKKYSAEVDSVEYGLPAPAKTEACGSCETEGVVRTNNGLNRLVKLRTQHQLSFSKPTER